MNKYYAALDRGAIFGFVIPSDRWMETLQEQTGIANLPVKTARTEFDKFYAGYVAWLRKKERTNPELRAEQGLRLFVGEPAYFTPVGQILTLLAEKNLGAVFSRLLQRDTANTTLPITLLPNQHSWDRIIKDYLASLLRDQCQKLTDTEETPLDTFAKDTLVRVLDYSPTWHLRREKQESSIIQLTQTAKRKSKK